MWLNSMVTRAGSTSGVAAYASNAFAATSSQPSSASRIQESLQYAPVILALVACGVAALGLMMLAASGPLYRVGVLSLPNAFGMLRWAAYVGIAAIVLAVPPAFIGYARGQRPRVLVAALALLG